MIQRKFRVHVKKHANISPFLTKLASSRVPVKELYVDGDSAYFVTSKLGVKAARKFRKQYGLKIRVQYADEHSIIRYLFHSPFFLLSCLVPFVASFFLWQVEVDSSSPEVADRMTKKLDQAKIVEYMPLPLLPSEGELRQLLMTDEPTLSWIRFEQTGAKLTVFPMEAPKTQPPPQKDEKPAHLVAKTNGVITHFALKSGERVSRVHQTVQKGDVLASGIVERGEEQRVVGAVGAVYADYWLRYEFEVPRTIYYETKGEEQVTFKWNKPWQGHSPWWQLFEFEKTSETIQNELYLEEGMEQSVLVPLLKYKVLSNERSNRTIKEENVLHVAFENDKVIGTILFLINEDIAIKRPISQGD